ncbi:transcription elongation factor Spt5 [Candidatus Woesearchaeota archaeon]|nr:transcription elongation factor Spt5 [Candidatus Woesearchaeota archaeon]
MKIFALRTTAGREDQVLDFIEGKANKEKLNVYSAFRPHGMKGYIFLEAETRQDAEQCAFNINYAKGILPNDMDYSEVEHLLEQVKKDYKEMFKLGDVCEIITGPFKRENAKITRIDPIKEEIVVQLLESAVPIPITVKMDAVKVIRRDSDDDE